MSYWVSLFTLDKELVTVTNHSEGGTYALGGSERASLNVTYNYSGPIASAFNHAASNLGWEEARVLEATKQGLRYIHDKRAGEVLPLLKLAVEFLGDQPDRTDYWKPSTGNAGHALAILRDWAAAYPAGEFEVS
jgi:hypothetical protein